MTTVLSDMHNWVELPSDLGLKTTWNLLWTWSRPRVDYDKLLSWQRVNHYPRAAPDAQGPVGAGHPALPGVV